ncbi:hypothetical protein Noda2021_03520 [Candidatus Dependentiae bacterium Noda2021]|nr:hypothetical protein Noda2021_03520 [Candidatus Dependentiae bacterium Noda2021]
MMNYILLIVCVSWFCANTAQETDYIGFVEADSDEIHTSAKLFETIEEVLLWDQVGQSLPNLPYSDGKGEIEEHTDDHKGARVDVFAPNPQSKPLIVFHQPMMRVQARPHTKKNHNTHSNPLIAKVDKTINERIAAHGGIPCCKDSIRCHTRKEVAEHFAMEHLCDGEFKCPFPLCSHSYISDRQNITDHYIKSHFIPYIYTCFNKQCTVVYKSRNALIKHIKDYHGQAALN